MPRRSAPLDARLGGTARLTTGLGQPRCALRGLPRNKDRHSLPHDDTYSRRVVLDKRLPPICQVTPGLRLHQGGVLRALLGPRVDRRGVHLPGPAPDLAEHAFTRQRMA